MDFKFQALGTNIVLEVPKVDETTKGGLLLPEEMKKKNQLDSNNYFKVLSVGEEVVGINVGDEVLVNISTKNVTGYMIDNKECIMVYRGSVLGKKI